MGRTYNGKAYRFIGFDGLQNTIETEQLRLTHPSLFNDPIDSNSYIAPFNWEKWNELNPEDIEKRCSNMLFKSIYISSFSREYKSEKSYLMWGHYAHSHKGVCFEIDFSKTDFLCKPDTVVYPNNIAFKRDRIRTKHGGDFKHLSDKDSKDITFFMLTNKHKIWRYEKEVRLIVDVDYLNNKDADIIRDYNETHLYVKFDLSLISKIIFGINADRVKEIKIANLLEEKGVFPKFEKMYINPVNLKLESKAYFKAR